ncbi:SLC13 family permease [Aromatoleum petrolei]|uniref:SLC13 family permease n=1 Tax=Aromatoleum petrolei TaxID=76116 RepID=A0ABX1MWN9_9RHOO|nr:SLC13 family permease [Aromatoleum petrolei]NMF90384.1 SLC13 family permease [Aromatoleum petrolei]QTQ35722.1 Putative permease [Aromatoleum petrolei]
MTPYLVLLSIVALLTLLIRGRTTPAILFTVWAAAYYLLGFVSEREWLAGYTNSALTTLILLLLVSLALERSPLLDRFSDLVLKGGPARAILRLSVVTTLFSAVLNNTAVVGALLGVVSKQRHVAPSKLLIPLSYAAILGGVTTLIGTSTNLVVNSFVIDAGLPALEMFQFSLVGIPLALACIAVIVLCSRLLPAHEPAERESRQSYFLEAQVTPDSPLTGRSIEQNRLRNLDGLFLLELEREGRLISPVGPDEILAEGDILVFTGQVEKVQALQQIPGLQVFGTRADALLGSNLVEVVISNESILPNRTLRDVDFRLQFDAGVVGIRRGDKRLTGQLGRIPLRVGDALLLAVGPDFAQHRNIDRNFHLLDTGVLRPRLTPRQSTLALSGFALAIALSAVGVWPLLNCLLVLLATLLATRILSVSEMRRRFPFDLLVTIGSALAIAKALESSGAAELVADGMRSLFDGHGVLGAFIGVYLITVVLTEVITNNAAAALAFPIALSTARAFDVDPMPFVMAIAYGASAGFLIPFGYQTHLMVMSPGRYRTLDFFRIGLPVSLTYSAAVLLLVPVFFPF